MPLQYLKKEVTDEVDVLHADKHQNFLHIDFSTVVIKVSCKLILSLLISMINHFQSTPSNKFIISSKYLKKEVRNGVRFLHAGNYQSFYKFALLLLMEATRHVKVPKIGSWEYF